MKRIIVTGYDPTWPARFESLRARAWDVVSDFALAIEHVGSTSVPGLAAKPIIDMTVVVASRADVARAIVRLESLQYEHRGDLGIPDREAFHAPPEVPAHHLYLCPASSVALANHLTIRDYLRTHPEAVEEYSDLKRRLACEFATDTDGYVDGKTDFLVGILRRNGFSPQSLNSIERANRAK